MPIFEYTRFEQKLAFHTAPALLGIKCASLISLCKTEFDLDGHMQFFNSKAVSKGLKMNILYTCKERALILLYNENQLKLRLEDEKSKAILKMYGYCENSSLKGSLDRLAERIGSEEKFPHEIGVFLGYPPEDIIGFIENNGDNYKLCGYWKVYGNAEKAKRTFENYDKCRKFLCNKLEQGYDIYQALKIS